MKTQDKPNTIDSGRRGRVHVYTGDGKGKTTAAFGLALRAAGAGMRVLIVQFFKPEKDPSGEKDMIRNHISSIELLRQDARHPYFTGDSTDREAVGKSVKEMFGIAKARAGEGFGLLVLDEIIGEVNEGFLNVNGVVSFLDGRPEGLEVVLTGRDAPAELVRISDYVTEMLKIKHPYDEGVSARKGIDF